MAGPSIKVSFLSDFTKLRAGIGDVASAAKTGGSTLKDAFAPGLSILNRSGVLGGFTEALDGVGEAIGQVKNHIHDLPLAMAAAGAGIAGIGVALSAIGSKDQAAHQQLQASVEATGKSYDDYEGQVDKAIKKQEKFGDSAVQTQDALRVLTQATGDPAKALSLLNTATDLAAAKHEDLTSAASQLGKAYNGNARILKEFGLTAAPKASTATKALETATKGAEAANKAYGTTKQKLADLEAIDAGKKKLTTTEAIRLRDAQNAVKTAAQNSVDAHKKLALAQDAAKKSAHAQDDTMTALSNKLKGQAAAAADTFGGHLKELKAKIEDNVAAIGQKYGPALQAAGAGMAGLGAALKIGQGAMEAAKAAALGTRIELGLMSAATKVAAAAQWLLNIAMDANPIVLIVLAIAALIAIIILVLVKTGVLKDAWNELKKVADIVWHGILTAVKDVWNWIKANWPLLLGILLGPIGLAAALIYRYWDQILNGIKVVWNWIKANWPLLVAVLTGPVGIAVLLIIRYWSQITGALAGVINWIRGAWGGLYGFLTGVIQSAVNWIRGAWGSVTGAVSGVVSTIEGLFSGLVNYVAGLPGRVTRAAFGMFDGIINIARDGVNTVIGWWNHLAALSAIHISTPDVKILGKTVIPSAHLDTGQLIPSIPKLAQGGLITNDGLVYAHAGEAISPMPRGLQGPAVIINDAHFSNDIDIDQFSRRLGWHLQTQRV